MGYVDFFFQLNLLPPYSLLSHGDQKMTPTGSNWRIKFYDIIFYVISNAKEWLDELFVTLWRYERSCELNQNVP